MLTVASLAFVTAFFLTWPTHGDARGNFTTLGLRVPWYGYEVPFLIATATAVVVAVIAMRRSRSS
ncbi:hypothetical protein [Aquipuribacter sp. SD81]|uniref:hypothetical protein n=1 Tax=Aquipuribacter sp. SD81 TaxID=3127703 RepID=UPI003018ACCF